MTFVKKVVMIILTNVEVKKMSGEKRLPDTELEVMTAIWKCEIPVKTSEIARHIERDWTMSTIQALLARLEEKVCAVNQRRRIPRSGNGPFL